MGMASGEGGIYFATDVGKWGAKGAGFFFSGLPTGENLFTPCVYTQDAGIFVESPNVREKHDKNFDLLTRPPSRPLAAGPSLCHLLQAATDLVKTVIEPEIQKNVPSLLKSIHFNRFSLGSVPPRVVSIRTVSRVEDSVTLHLDILYEGDPDISISFAGVFVQQQLSSSSAGAACSGCCCCCCCCYCCCCCTSCCCCGC